MDKGKIIVIEGACDGIGKSTQFKMLREHFESDGLKVASHHFPSYNTDHGSLAVKYLKGEFGNPKDLSPYFVNSLYAIDRGITWNAELKPLYEEGKIILLDRYTTSSLIYQSALIEDLEEKKRFLDYVIDYEYSKLGIREPDNVIFLSAPFDLVTAQRSSRTENDGVSNDIHERNIEFQKKAYDSAMFVSDYLSFNKIDCCEGDKMRSEDDIHEEIYRLVYKNNNK